MKDLPKFRRLEDVQRYLQDLSREISETSELVTQQQKLLASIEAPKPAVQRLISAAFAEFDVTPSQSRKSGLRDSSTAVPTINKVVIPNLSKLKDQYGLVEELHNQYAALTSVETQIAMQFPDKRQGPLYDKTLGSINELRHAVEVQLRKVFTFLSQVAKKHVPQEFEAYTSEVSEAVLARVPCESSDRFLYVSTQDKAIYFTEYLLLVNAVNEDGKIAPHLYIVTQWYVGRAVEVFVEHEFAPPHQLSGGSEVKTVKDAVTQISHMLDLEGFAVALGNAPLGLNMKTNPNKLQPSQFRARDFISKILVSDKGDELIFTFKANLNAETKKNVAYQIFQDVKTLLRTRKLKLRMKISSAKVTLYIADLAQGTEVSTTDVDFLKERFGLSDSAVNKIARIINQEKQ